MFQFNSQSIEVLLLCLLQKKPYLNKLKNGLPPPSLTELELLFANTIVDGSTAYVSGQDFYDQEEMEEDEMEEEEEPAASPTTTSSRKCNPWRN